MPAKMTVRGMPLFNSSGDIDVASTGFQYIIDTLSYIRSKIITQKFFEIMPGDYIPMDVGEAAWKSEIVQNLEYQEGGNFEEGFTDQGGSRIAQTDVALSKNRMPVKTWRKKCTWNIAQLAEAANVGNWDVVESKLRGLKKNWDLGLQNGAFNGFNIDSDMTGLLNNSTVNINTTLIAKKISLMDDSEFQTFVGKILDTYFTNSNHTVMFPDVFMMPADDYLGLGSAASSLYPNITKKEYLKNVFSDAAGKEIKMVPMVYCQSAYNTESKDRYVLYRNDPETLKMTIPVDLTMNQAYTINGFDYEQLAYGQVSGVLINRPREVLYADLTAST
jgi:hypothetical protein